MSIRSVTQVPSPGTSAARCTGLGPGGNFRLRPDSYQALICGFDVPTAGGIRVAATIAVAGPPHLIPGDLVELSCDCDNPSFHWRDLVHRSRSSTGGPNLVTGLTLISDMQGNLQMPGRYRLSFSLRQRHSSVLISGYGLVEILRGSPARR